MKTDIDKLKLGQTIVVETTNYFNKELLEMVKTDLHDAKIIDDKRYEIVLGKGSWGACPTRSRENSIIFENDIEKVVDNILERTFQEGLSKKLDDGRSVLYVDLGDNYVSLKVYNRVHKVVSLKEGTKTKYSCGHSTINVIEGVEYAKVFDNISDARLYVVEFIKELLCQ